MRKIVLTFGLIAGAILSVMMIVTFALPNQIEFDNGAIIGYTTMVLAFLMVYFGVKSYRDTMAGGRVSFGRAFQVGLSIMAIASVGYVGTWEVIYFKFEPDFMDKYAAYELEKAKRSGATNAQIAAQTQELAHFREIYKKPLVNIAYTFLEPLPVGLLITLISAGVLSRKRKAEGAAPA